MKYTDRFFKFPIRLYDGVELRKTLEKEERTLELDPDSLEAQETPWVQGSAAIYAEDIIAYNETFSRAMTIEDVLEQKGGDLTLIETKGQEYVCMWNFKKFEEKLNAHMEKISANRQTQPTTSYKMFFGLPPTESATNSINDGEIKE